MQYSIGSADLYLTSNPQVTFFKQPIKRHTRFSVDHTTVPIQGVSDFGQRPSITISKAGDLLLNIWLEITLPNLADYQFSSTTGKPPEGVRWCDKVGLALIKSAELEIGGQRIERIVPEFLDCWTELTQSEERLRMLNDMWSITPSSTNNRITVPLMFYFHDQPSQAIPLCAIMYHDIRVNLELERAENLLRSIGDPITTAFKNGDMTKPLSISEFECHVTYIMLDPDERRRFTDTAQEYLITTTQYNGADPYISGNSVRRFDLTFSNPVKELIWIYSEDTALAPNSVTGNRLFDYHSYGGNGGPMITGGNTTAWTVSVMSGDFDTATGASVVLPNPANASDAIVDILVKDGNGIDVEVDSKTISIGSICVRIPPVQGVQLPLHVRAIVTASPMDGIGGLPPLSTAKLVLLGTDRFKERSGVYFNKVQPFEHHKRVPSRPIYCYSFGMWPEELYPSGTANFSRIDSAALVLTFPASTASGRVKIFARAFNVLRIDKGIASLVYTS
jgi:hypothetical protein